MVNGALSIGGIIGVLLSGAFVYFEIGRFAAPQVPRTVFDERRELFGYTAGLFVGVPIAFLFLLLSSAVTNQALISAVVDVALVAGASEIAQWAFARTKYFGGSAATPFYALGFRTGISAILILAVVTSYLGGSSLTWDGLAQMGAQTVALLAIQVNGGLLSLPRSPAYRGAAGGPLSGFVVGVAAFSVMALGTSVGAIAGAAAALLITGGLVPSYRRLRRRILERAIAPPEPEGEGRPPFGRTDLASEPSKGS